MGYNRGPRGGNGGGPSRRWRLRRGRTWRRRLQRGTTASLKGDDGGGPGGALSALKGPRVAPAASEGDGGLFDGSHAPIQQLRRGTAASSKEAHVVPAASEGDDGVFEGRRRRRPGRGAGGFEGATRGADGFGGGRRPLRREPRAHSATSEGDDDVFEEGHAPRWWLQRETAASSEGGRAPRRWLRRGACEATPRWRGRLWSWTD
ncbi:hypothetical protein GUJ93_ZPchr0007g3432 [Zizania palustris]|uniref:Uncharacterized protein n=1 Tax=Zizania palustris TaxID=103762 RepID=A0A8J5TDH0_ZIZPA|nr:hypothetical protein GUJ93_ZPchr0007g3432 [Zizania palustris]